MISHRKIALLAVIAAQSQAFAEEKADKETEKKVVPYGLIQGYSNIADSQYGTDPDFTLANVRFGVKVSEGIARGQIETQYLGNLPETGEVNSKVQGLNSVLIRRADVGLALPSGTTLSLGRVRMGGADAWGVDATTTVDQFGWMDGASIAQKIALGEKNEVNFTLGVGNSMGFPSGRDSRPFSRSAKSDRGMVVGARANFEGVVAAAYFGMEKNQIQQQVSSEQVLLGEDGKPLAGKSLQVFDKDGTDTTNVVKAPAQFVKLKQVMTARDVSHFESSLGYNADNWAVGGWYQSIVKADLKIANYVNNKLTTSPITADDEKFGAKQSPKTTSTTVGVGFNSDSSLLGVTDVLQKGALLTLGGSIVQTAERDANKSNDSDESKNDKLQYSIGLGYQAGGFNLELGHELSTSQSESFNYKNAEQGDAVKPSKKYSNLTYIVGIYSF